MDKKIVQELRLQWPEVYSARISKTEYLFRALTFAEYDELASLNDSMTSAELEDHVVAKAVLYPTNLDKVPAGAITQLADQIIEHSAFNSVRRAKEIMDVKRSVSASVRQMMKAFVIATMPSYKDTDLDMLTFSQLAEKVALAEQIIRVTQATHGIQSEIGVLLNIVDPDEEVMVESKQDPVAAKLQQAMRAQGLDQAPPPGWDYDN